MDTNDTTNPVAEAPEAEAPEVDTEETSEDLSAYADENDAEGGEAPPEEEYLEIEHDGKTIRIPKAAEPLLMFNKDYTQKTQTLAEQRREFEQQRQVAQWEEQTKQALFSEEAQLHSVHQRLEQFQGMNWAALAQQNMQQHAVMQAEYTQLRDYADRLSGHVQGRRAELSAMKEQETAISLERAVTELNKPDPTIGWDGKFDADKGRKITDFLVSKGADPNALREIRDPFVIKMAHLAMIGEETLRKQNATLKPKAPVANPVPQVATGKTRTGPSNPDKLPAKEWVKWRESQLAKQRNR